MPTNRNLRMTLAVRTKAIRASLFVAAAVASLAASGCQAVHGLGSDLQFLSDRVQTMVIVDDPMND